VLLNQDFLNTIEPLRIPAMGTELMGPLLYSLIRSMRPCRIVEAGMGYTTPFIAQALADNLKDHNREMAQLKKKLQLWNERRETLISHQREASLGTINLECMLTDPPLSSPSYYCSGYKPILYAVDNMTDTGSSAARVKDILQKLDLLHVVDIHHTDFRSFLDKVDRQWLPFDLIWNDSENVGFVELFDLLNPNGGVMVMHDTLTSKDGIDMVTALKQAQATYMSADFELLNLLEPHKLFQSGATIIRRISDYKPKIFPKSLTVEMEQEIRQILKAD
jgi:predicted O-methyltransferase YrrM